MYRAQRTTLRELDRRTGDGVDVSLLWDPRTKGVSVAVTDTRQGGRLSSGSSQATPSRRSGTRTATWRTTTRTMWPMRGQTGPVPESSPDR